MAVYYPAMAVKLVIRFDEALLSGSTPAPVNATQAAEKIGLPSSPSAEADLFGDSADGLTHSLIIVPTKASIELPTFRQAQKFSMSFAFRDLPLDPRAIRSMAARIYIGTVTPNNFSAGMRGLSNEVHSDGGRLASQLALLPENLKLVGLVDTMVVDHTESGSAVSITGRGISGALLDSKISATTLKKLDLNKPINEVVAQICSFYPQGGKIPIRCEPDEWPQGRVPSPASPELLARENKGQDGNKANSPMKGDPNSSAYWDIITNYCNIVGATPYFIADELWIRPTKSLFTQMRVGASPFKGGNTRDIQLGDKRVEATFRKMIYGRNLLNFSIERKFGGATVPMVQTVSIDMSKPPRERLIFGNWPPLDKQKHTASAVDPSGKQARSEALRIPVPGVTSVARLTSIAENIYNEIGRGELGGKGSTKNLASLGGDNSDADILRLLPGDAIEFAVDAGGAAAFPPVASELTRQAAQSPGALSEDIQKRLGFSKKLADVIAGTATGKFAALQNVFRVANVKFDWDISSGIAVDFDFQNYVTARYDFEGATGLSEEVTKNNALREGSYISSEGSS